MTEVTYYVADDGKRFNTEEECLHYEENLAFEKIKNDLVMFDSEDFVISDMIDFENVRMVVIKTKPALTFFLNMCYKYGVRQGGIYKCGFYKWDSYHHAWYNVFEELHKLRHATEVAQVFECEFEFEAEV